MSSINETLKRNGVFDIEVPSPLPALELSENNLWMGIMLCVYDKSTNAFIEDETGTPLMVMPQIGGTEPLTPGFYRYEWSDLSDPNNFEVVDTGEKISLDRSLVFVPLEVYTAGLAPNGGSFAVYDNGMQARYKGGIGERVHVVKNDLGDISFTNYPRDIGKNEYTFSQDTLLLRIREKYRPETKASLQVPIVRVNVGKA